MLDKQPLVGTWSLLSWKHIDPIQTNSFYPFGETAIGQLIYTDSGQMSLFLMQPNRALFKDANPTQATGEEKWRAYDEVLSYSGTYQLDSTLQQVAHKIEISPFPNWVGQTNTRFYDISSDLLTLRSQSSDKAHHCLVWKRKYSNV